MKSMTGYGKASRNESGISLDIEIKSVNSKYLDLRLYLPRELSPFEMAFRQLLATRISRGAVEVRANLSDHRDPKLGINQAKLLKYYALMQEASNVLNIPMDVTLAEIIKEPGVIENAAGSEEDKELYDLFNSCAIEAIDKLADTMREEAEGIRATLLISLDQIERGISGIQNLIQPYRTELFENLNIRINEILNGYKIDNLEQRLVQELAIYIDKYDIQEEISRIISHIKTFRECLAKDSSIDIGKTLNFISQELQREANTLGSKFSTKDSFVFILIIKEEVEKCREIVQNVA